MNRITATIGVGLLLTFTGLSSAQNLLKKLQQRIEQAAGAADTPQRAADTPQRNTENSAAPTAPAGRAGDAPGQAGFVADDHGKAEGVQILTIDDGGAAALGGLRKSDTIVSVNGSLVKTLDDLGKALVGRKAGEQLRLGVLREGKLLEQTIKLQPQSVLQPPVERASSPAGSLPAPADARSAKLGVTVEPLTAEIRRRYRVSLTKGAFITSIVQGSPAHRYQLPIGGVIVAVGNQRVDNPEDLRRAISQQGANREIEVTYYQQNRLYRRKITLAPVVTGNPATAFVPATRGSGRPVLDRLERVLDRVVERPQEADSQVVLLRQQLELMRAELQRLQLRVEQLEKARSNPATNSKPTLNGPGAPSQGR